jgi:hypothetical protein
MSPRSPFLDNFLFADEPGATPFLDTGAFIAANSVPEFPASMKSERTCTDVQGALPASIVGGTGFPAHIEHAE